MPDLQMSGDIGFEELSPQLQALIGAGGSGGFGGNVSLKTEVLSVTATEERQKEFTIPKSGYIQGTHNFELRLGSVWIHPDRYQIQGNKVVFNEDEVGIAQGRRLDFVFCYLEKGEDGESSFDGSSLKDGSVTKEKLSEELQKQIDGHDTNINEVKTSIDSVRQSVNEVSTKLDSSVKDVESSNNFNSIRIIKNDGTTTDVPIKILGGGSDTSLNVFKTVEQGGSFTATAETNSFVIDELEENMDISLVFKNLLLVKDADFTIDKGTKTVVLTFNLKVDETIYYTLTGTSFSYNDLDGAPNVGDTNSLVTTSKEVVGAINEVSQQVGNKVNKLYFVEDFNSVDTSERFIRSGANTPNAPSAAQFAGVKGVWDSNFDFTIGADIAGVFWVRKSKENWQQVITSKEINDYLGKRGIPSGITTLRDLPVGVYSGFDAHDIFTDYPQYLIKENAPFCNIQVTQSITNGFPSKTVIITAVNNAGTIQKIAIGSMIGVMGEIAWDGMATTTKTSFNCTATTGITINHQNCYQLNGEFFISLRAYKTDGSVFATGANIIAINAIAPAFTIVGGAMGRTDTTTSAWLSSLTCFADTAKNIVVNVSTNTIKEIYLTVKGAI